MMWRRTGLALAVILVVAASVGWRWWHNHPPYGPEALAIKSSLEFVSYTDAQAALGKAANAPLPTNEGDQLVLGRVSWQTPPKPLGGGEFRVFLIDKRTNLKPEVISAAASGIALSIGGGGTDSKIAQRYAWLRGVAGVRVGDNRSAGLCCETGVLDEKESPITFVALFPHPGRPDPGLTTVTAPVELSDLLLAVVYMGPRDQVYWAQRLQG